VRLVTNAIPALFDIMEVLSLMGAVTRTASIEQILAMVSRA
jgi:hypothetical protein